MNKPSPHTPLITTAPNKHHVRKTIGLFLGAGGLGGIFFCFGTYFACTGEALISQPIDITGCIEVSKHTFGTIIAWAKQNDLKVFVSSIAGLGVAIKLILPPKPKKTQGNT